MTDGNNTMIHIPIKGMVCEGCVESVKQALESVPGVEHVEVSLNKKEALVTYDPSHATKNTLQRAIQTAGYDIGDETDRPASQTPQ